MMTSYRSMSLGLLLALAIIVGPVSFTVDAQIESAHGGQPLRKAEARISL